MSEASISVDTIATGIICREIISHQAQLARAGKFDRGLNMSWIFGGSTATYPKDMQIVSK